VRRQRKTYDKEFKEAAVKMVLEQGLAVSKVAKDLGVSPPSVGGWVREVEERGKKAFPGKGKPHDEELRRLQRELERVKMERDILKKAITFFRDEER
jgi:transposase